MVDLLAYLRCKKGERISSSILTLNTFTSRRATFPIVNSDTNWQVNISSKEYLNFKKGKNGHPCLNGICPSTDLRMETE